MSSDDIVVAGISMRQLADVCGTPTSHSAASVIPESGQRPSVDNSTGVLVTRVVQVTEHRSGFPVVLVDARLDNLRLVWSEARVIGPKTGSRGKLSLLVRKPGTLDLVATQDLLVVELHARVAAGDLIAIPSRSISTGLSAELHPVTGRADWRPNSVFEGSRLVRDDPWETTQ